MRKPPNHGYYFCYSKSVLAHLKRRGFKYICTGLHPTSGKQFFLFEQNAKLSEALTEYSEQRA